MRNLSPSGILAREFLERFPSASENSLAKLLFKQHPKVFTSVSQARNSLQWHGGKRIGGTGYSSSSPIKRNTGFSRQNNFKPQLDVPAKVLILDIETAPILAFVWGMWEQNVSMQQMRSDWFCLTWSAKWLFEDKIYSARLTSNEAKTQNDKRIISSIWQMLNDADIVITHNGDKFDLRKLNTRFLIHGMNPPLPYISIDTLKHNRKQFAHSSNKLDYINRSLGITRKMENDGFPLWEKCYMGDALALKKMEDYNVQDVKILEDLYLRIRQWIRPHPNLGLHITDEKTVICHVCTGKNLKREKKNYFTQTARYELCRCNDCGAISRERVNVLSKVKSKDIKKPL